MCGGRFCGECLVEDRRAFPRCRDCAIAAAGIRRNAGRRPVVSGRELKRLRRDWRRGRRRTAVLRAEPGEDDADDGERFVPLDLDRWSGPSGAPPADAGDGAENPIEPPVGDVGGPLGPGLRTEPAPMAPGAETVPAPEATGAEPEPGPEATEPAPDVPADPVPAWRRVRRTGSTGAHDVAGAPPSAAEPAAAPALPPLPARPPSALGDPSLGPDAAPVEADLPTAAELVSSLNRPRQFTDTGLPARGVGPSVRGRPPELPTRGGPAPELRPPFAKAAVSPPPVAPPPAARPEPPASPVPTTTAPPSTPWTLGSPMAEPTAPPVEGRATGGSPPADPPRYDLDRVVVEPIDPGS